MMDASSFELPGYYDYILTAVDQERSENGFNISFRCNILTKEETVAWMQEFQEIHKVQFRVARTYPASGRYNTFKITYRCQHGSPYKAKECSNRTTKNTDCNATISITIKRFGRDSKKSKEEKQHPCIVNLNNVHNHTLLSEENLRYRDVSFETKQNIIELYHKGYSPSMAYHKLKNDLMELYQDDFFRIEKDRSIIPDLPFFYNLFYAEKRKEKVEKWKTYYNSEIPLQQEENRAISTAGDRKGIKRKQTADDEAASKECLESENNTIQSQGGWYSSDYNTSSSLTCPPQSPEAVVCREERTFTSLENIHKADDSLDRKLFPSEELLETVKNQLCRVCGTKQDNLSPIFCEDVAGNDALPMSRKLVMYLPLQVRKDDGLPSNICAKCLDSVESWHDLHVSCLAADSVLHKMFAAGECRDESESREEEERRVIKENDPVEEKFVHARKSCEFKELLTIRSFENGEREVKFSESFDEMDEDINMENDVAVDHQFLEDNDDNSDDDGDDQSLENSDDEMSYDVKIVSTSENSPPRTEKDFPIYSCRHCGEDLMKKEEYVSHKQKCAVEPTICDVCGESVPQRRQFRKHIIKHFRKRIQRSYICEKCGKELTSMHGLQRHMNSQHSKETELYNYCESCSKRFTTENAFRNHMLLHHKMTVELLEDYYLCLVSNPCCV